MLDTFDKFKGDKLNESYKDISLLEKAWSKYLVSINQSRKDLEEVKSILWTIKNNAPTVAQKELAEQNYDSIKGNVEYVLRGDVRKYTDWVDKDIKELINLPSKEEKIKIGKLPDSVVNYGVTPTLIINVKRILEAKKITDGYFGDSLSGTYLWQGRGGSSVSREFYTLRSFFKSSNIDKKDKDKFKNIFLKSTGYLIDYNTYGNVTFKKQ